MLKNVRWQAVAAGAFCGYVLPYLLASWVKISILGDVPQPHMGASVPTDYTIAYLFMFGVGPVGGGLVAAHLSTHRPVLHAALAAVFGSVFYAVFGAGLLLAILFVSLSAVAASQWKRRKV